MPSYPVRNINTDGYRAEIGADVTDKSKSEQEGVCRKSPSSDYDVTISDCDPTFRVFEAKVSFGLKPGRTAFIALWLKPEATHPKEEAPMKIRAFYHFHPLGKSGFMT